MRYQKTFRLTNSKKGGTTLRRPRRSVPYVKVARMWKEKKPLAVIARAIGFIDKDNPKDPYHSFRNVLYRMFNHGFENENGKHCMLRRRVSQSTVRACRKAGKRAWATKAPLSLGPRSKLLPHTSPFAAPSGVPHRHACAV